MVRGSNSFVGQCCLRYRFTRHPGPVRVMDTVTGLLKHHPVLDEALSVVWGEKTRETMMSGCDATHDNIFVMQYDILVQGIMESGKRLSKVPLTAHWPSEAMHVEFYWLYMIMKHDCLTIQNLTTILFQLTSFWNADGPGCNTFSTHSSCSSPLCLTCERM
jgi:hypothetical protein